MMEQPKSFLDSDILAIVVSVTMIVVGIWFMAF